MSVEAILADLLDDGLQLWLENGRLRYRARSGGLTTERRQRLVRHRDAIVELLAEGEKLAPTSFAQRQMWVAEELDARDATYHVPLALELRCALDRPALASAIQALVRRHEILRTTFRCLDGRPFQSVASAAATALPLVDLRGLPATTRRGVARRLAAATAARPFELEGGRLSRFLLFRFEATVHWLLVTFHHAIVDGGSLTIFQRELTALLAADSGPGALPPLAGQYADFAAWQRSTHSDEARAVRLAWWRRRLDGVVPVELPADRPPVATTDDRAVGAAFTVPRELGDALRRCRVATGSSLFVIGLAGFLAWLYRWTGQRDLIVATPVDQRDREELEGLIGFFVQLLPVRARAPRKSGFAALIDEVKTAVVEGREHQDVPFERLVRELAPERAASLHPLFQVSFVLDAGERPSPKTEIALEEVEIPFLRVAFDLELRLADGGELRGILAAPAARFDATTVERWSRSYLRLLEAATGAPERSLEELDLLGRGERHQLVTEWNAGRIEPVTTLHGLFEIQAAARPAAVAVSAERHALTYGELDRRADRLAHLLARRGIGREDLVAFLLDRSPAAVVTMLAILKAGGAYLPLDPTSPPQRLVELLGDAGASLLVTTSRWRRQMPALAVPVIELDDAATAGSAVPCAPAVDPAQLAYVIHTSGSTGRPKGVAITHANVVRLFAATRESFAFGTDDVWTLFHSLAFDFSVWETWGALVHGGRLVLVPYLTSRSPDDFLDLLEQQRVTVLNQTPSAFRMLSHAVSSHPRPLALRRVIFGGEALAPAALRPWLERHGDRRPRLVNMYGITETTVHVTFRALSWADARRGDASPIGRPLDDLVLHVLDGTGGLLPVGIPGELFVAGAGLARGYLGRPGVTATRFLPSISSRRPGERMYRTGDRARRRADGELDYLGRIDRQVKIRGFRIEPGEIETVVEGHDGVERCVVVAREAPEAGIGRRLVAYVVARGGRMPAIEELRAFAAARLPPPMIPAAWMAVPALPLTTQGKLDPRALPEPTTRSSGRGPRGPVETFLAECWCGVLGRHRIDAEESFFTAGGDSILALRLVAAIRQGGYALTLPQLFRHPTIADLARIVAPVRAAPEPVPVSAFDLLAPADRDVLGDEDLEDAYPLTRLQAGMIYHSELTPASAVYHDVVTFRVRGSGDPRALGAALAELARRHPVLRTSFALAGFSEPLQKVHRAVVVPLAVTDLRGAPMSEADAAVHDWIAQEKQRPIDYERPPLLRCRLFRGDDDFHLGLAFHHAILDGWSVALLVTELLRLHAAAIAGEPWPEPPPPAVAFRDFVAGERRLLASEEARSFWRDNLRDAPATRLPRSSAGDGPTEREIPVPPATERGLRRLAATAGAPIKSVLLAAHVRVLGHLAGENDVVTGLVANGRPEAAGSDQIAGLFLNTLPLRYRMAGGSWTSLVRDVHRAELEAFPHRAFPLAEIQRLIGRGPLFETAFNFTHFHVYRDLAADGGPEILDAGGYEQTNFALVVDAGLTPVGGALGLHLTDDGSLGPARVAAWADLYGDVLETMAARPEERYERWSPPIVDVSEPFEAPAPDSMIHHRPPAAATTKWLARLFARLLERETVGMDDDFFDLGGHSLLALHLMAEIERRRGRRLPLATLLATPTVAGLARIVDGEDVHPAPPLVAIRPGGSRPPMFWIHAADGQVLAYRELIRRLTPGRPVYGLTTEGRETPFDIVEVGAMARRYVGAIRERQPRGPYFLGGWSLGGALAFEVARRLRHEDEEVALLAILHSAAPAHAARRRYAGQVVLFLPRGEATGDVTDGWRRLVDGGLEVLPVTGDHHTMLREPHVGELADLLDDRLRRAGG